MRADGKGDGEGRARRTGYTMGDEYLHNGALTALGLWLASVGRKESDKLIGSPTN